MADKVLKLVFKNGAGSNLTISVDNPKDGLTEVEVTQAMNNIIAQNIFTSKGGDLVEAVGATIVTQSALI